MRQVDRHDGRERPVPLPFVVEIRDDRPAVPHASPEEADASASRDGPGPSLTVLRGGQEPHAAYGARRRRTHVAVQVGAPPARLVATRYRWDADTGILVARLTSAVGLPTDDAGDGHARAGAVELEGPDGSWVTLDLRGGRVCGLQIAVWPSIRRRLGLTPPLVDRDGSVGVPAAPTEGDAVAPTVVELEVDTDLAVDADPAAGVFHLRVGRPRAVRVVRVGRDMLVDVDAAGVLAGLWLTAVPPRSLPG